MQTRLNRLFPLSRYTDPVRRYRAVGTYITGSFMLVGALAALLFAAFVPNATTIQPMFPLFVVSSAAFVIGAVLAVVLTRVGQQLIGALILLLLWLLMALAAAQSGGVLNIATSIMLVGIALAALLIGGRMVIATAIASCLIVLEASLVNSSQGAGAALTVAFPLFLLLGLLGVITYALANGLTSVVQISAGLQLKRDQGVEAKMLISQRLLAAQLDMDKLVNETLDMVRERSASADNVQLFLTDSQRRNVTLVATTHLGDQASIGLEIGIGSLSAIGRVAITGQLILVRATSEERPHRRMAFLPGMRSELALPLRVGDEVIGVLDVQSTNGSAFEPADTTELETLASQIAMALRGGQRYADSQSLAAENIRLFEQTRTALLETERLNRQLTGGAWTEFLQAQTHSPAFSLDLRTGQVENAAEWTPTLAEATRLNQITIQQTAQAKIVALPISIRNQPIGAMEFEIAPDQELSSEQLAVLQQVVDRLGLAAENTRLFEEAQRVGQREALVNEISAQIQATTNVEGVLAAATQSLADAFQAPRVAIRLGNPDSGRKT